MERYRPLLQWRCSTGKNTHFLLTSLEQPYKVLNFSIMKQARGAAKTTIKFKNLMRGNTIENTYRSGEKFETALIEKKQVQFTYQEGVSVVAKRIVDATVRKPHAADTVIIEELLLYGLGDL